MVAALLILLACNTSTSQAPQSAPTAAPTVPATPSASQPAATDIAKREGKLYDQRWLVILSSNKEVGLVPEGASTLAASDLPHHLARVSSSEFKGLMPCYDVVIADAFPTKAEAIAFSKQLTAAGIDNYPKAAGKWVGPQPRLDAWCAGARSAEAPVCLESLYFAEQHEDRTFVHLALDEVVSQRAQAGAIPARPVDRQRTTWAAELSAKSVGDFKVGQKLFVSDKNGLKSCSLDSFVLLTRGTPHFGYYEMGDQSRPACGEPEVFAEVGCKTIDAGLASASSFATARGVELPPEHALLAKNPFPHGKEWAQAKELAGTQAKELGEPLQEAVKSFRYDLDGLTYVGVYAHWTTGDGVNICGMDAVNIERFGVFDASGGVVIPLAPTSEFFEGATLYKTAAGDLLAEVRAWNKREVRSGDDADVCTLDYPFCDCPC